MEQAKSDRNIPVLLKKPRPASQKFTAFLIFTEKGNLNVAEWLAEPGLESNWKRLVKCGASHSRELDWVSYFLLIVKTASESLEERQIALAHLKCYYQETCYWETKKFWDYLQETNFSGSQIIWEWQEVFDSATAIFESLEKAQKDLKTFVPERSLKQFVKKVIFYNLSNWRDKKIGRKTQIKSSSLDASLTGDIPEEYRCFSRERQVEKALAKTERLKKERYISKKQEERVLVLFDSELEKLEKSVEKDSQTKKGKMNLRLWIFLVLTYGLNLRQNGAVEVFKSNNISISQAKISRSIKTFVLKLNLQLIKELKLEINEALVEDLNDEEEPIETRIKEWRNEVNEVLIDRLQEKVFTLAVMPKAQELKEAGLTMPIDRVREELEEWCDRSLQISINSEILPEKCNKNIEKVVGEFVEKLELTKAEKRASQL